MENRLHIGGLEVKEGWKLLNIQALPGVDYVGDVKDLSQFPDKTFDTIYASHVLEHLGQSEAIPTLQGLHRVLKDRGQLLVSVPDLDILCHMMLNPAASFEMKHETMRVIFGGQIDAYDWHYFGWTFEFLRRYCGAAGFSTIERVSSFGLFNDTSNAVLFGIPLSLNAIIRK